MSEHVVVLGATGGIGRELVRLLLARGHGVVAVARDSRRLEALETAAPAGKLTRLARPLRTELDASLLVRALRDLRRPVTAVVSALRGSVTSGRLLDRSAAEMLRTLEQDITPNFLAAKHLLPLLAETRPEGGRYIVLSGPMATCAWSGYAHVSIAAAALHMLTRALREEAKELPVVIQQLQVGRPVRSALNQDCACPDWIGADEVARHVLELVERRDTNVPVVELGAYGPTRRAPPALSPRSLS